VLGFETGVAETVDPLGGSYYVESLTDELERLATETIETVDAMGGAVAAIEAGFYQDEIHEAAYRVQRGIETEERVVVGVNRFVDATAKPVELQRISEEETARQVDGLRKLRASRDQGAVDSALADVEETARGTGNILPPMREALRLRATLGEVSDALRRVFGEYRPTY
jgi:methylmalonyl-CoA mutase N-terminal domain/subunit